MRFLLSSVLLIFLLSCGSYQKQQNFKEVSLKKAKVDNPYFSDSAKDYVYKADIKVFKNSFSGIFIAKKLGNQHHRIVFTTEMGNKIFDFEIIGKIFKINHILPEMDKKVLKIILKRDFFALFKEKPFIENSYLNENLEMYQARLLDKKHFYIFENKQLKKIVRARNGKEKTTYFFSGINDNIVNNIDILHQNIQLKIYLKKI